MLGYEHNWDDASAYPVTLINDAPNAFAGVAFHCYAVSRSWGGRIAMIADLHDQGNVAQMDDFHNAHSDKEICKSSRRSARSSLIVHSQTSPSAQGRSVAIGGATSRYEGRSSLLRHNSFLMASGTWTISSSARLSTTRCLSSCMFSPV